jgi:hypothetical protein
MYRRDPVTQREVEQPDLFEVIVQRSYRVGEPNVIAYQTEPVGDWVKRNHRVPLMGWEDRQLQVLARVLDSAAGEGELSVELADALRDAAERRGIKLPLAYEHGEADPQDWRRQIER